MLKSNQFLFPLLLSILLSCTSKEKATEFIDPETVEKDADFRKTLVIVGR